MMATVKKALRRFGGAALLDTLPEHDDRTERGPKVRANLDARLKMIEVDLDVQARRPLRYDKG